jgi:hypothetical protein
MGFTDSQQLRVCCSYACKKLKPCWHWSLPQFSALPQTDSSDYQAHVVMTSGDYHKTFFAESNLHAYSFLDCSLHFTSSIAFTALIFREFLTYVCTAILLRFLEAVGPSPRFRTSYPNRFFVIFRATTTINFFQILSNSLFKNHHIIRRLIIWANKVSLNK